MRRRWSQGTALGAVFLIILFLVLFGFTLANIATFDLRVVDKQDERHLAFEAAQAGLSRAAAALAENPRFGQSNEVLTESLSDGSRYRVTFDNSETQEWSVNNLEGLTGASGFGGRAVPPHHASIFALGTSPRGDVVVLEALYRLEALPYAVAGTGEVTANTTQILGAYTAADSSGGLTVAGHVYSGSSVADSTEFAGLSSISGDLRSVGGIVTSGGTSVGGDIDPYRSPDALPDFNIDSFDNSSAPGTTVLPSGPLLAPVLSGNVYINGDSTLLGAATLNNATVFVNGDLTMNTLALLGRGTFFVKGETRFLTGVNLTGSNKLTLFSQGVFLTHGDFHGGPALVVLGAIYANDLVNSSEGNVNLQLGSIITHVAEFTSFASFWLALGGEAKPLQVYWSQVR